MLNKPSIKWFFCLSFLLLALAAHTHEPSDMTIKYSAISGDLSIIVYHKVNSTSVHYINNMEIYLNRQGLELEDRLLITQKFFSQPIRNEQRAKFLVRDLNPGDELRVVAYCNLFGKIERIITITEKNWQESTQ